MSELTPGWVTARIDDMTADCTQRTPLANEEFQYIDIASIDRETKSIRNPEKLLGMNAPSRARKVVRIGDVLVSMTRPNLNAVALVPDHLDGQIASTGFEVLRAPYLDPRWLFYLVRTTSFVDRMSELVQGALYPAVRPRDVRGFEAPLAPLAEQKRIADKLDAVLARVGACRERLDRAPAILKRFRQAVLAAATSGKLTEEWREERGASEEWTDSDVQSVAKVGTGSTPLRSNPAFFASTGTPWITSAATAQPIVLAAEEFVTEAAIATHRLKTFPVGTLLVAMYGEGKTRGQVTELGIEATINQACAAVVVNTTKAMRQFVKLALQANYLDMRELAEGGSQPNLNLSKIKGFPLRLPPLDEQAEIVRRVESLFDYADRLEARQGTARVQVERLTPALLAKAFRGELVPQDPSDEPATVLLERIRTARAAAPAKPSLRKSAARTATTQKAEVAKLNRKDIQDIHLTTILKEHGPLTAEKLWSLSQLEIDDFYDQLKDEEAHGLLKEERGESAIAPRTLEATA